MGSLQLVDVGVTATRNGITRRQHHALIEQLLIVRDTYGGRPTRFILHHGDCVGGDHTAWAEARGLGWRSCAHPPTVETKWRAWTRNDFTQAPAPYSTRNQQIVEHVRLGAVIGMPDRPERDRSGGLNPSGTWQTIRRATELGLWLIVIHPDGSIE